MNQPLRGLYAITDSDLLAGERLLSWVDAALAGGARLLQYRDKSGDTVRRREEAEQLLRLCNYYGANLIINDDLPLAAELGTGLHLGRDDGNPAADPTLTTSERPSAPLVPVYPSGGTLFSHTLRRSERVVAGLPGPDWLKPAIGGALLGGTITIEDQDANELGESDYDPAPFVGATFRGRF